MKTRTLFIFLVLTLQSAYTAYPIRIAPRDSVQAFFGTRNVKVIFSESDKGLYLIDFSSDEEPSAVQTNAHSDAKLPVLSPDGAWSAYANNTTGEFSGSISSSWLIELPSGTPIIISDTASVPRFVKNNSVPTVVYATCSKNSYDYEAYTWQSCGEMITAAYNGGSFIRDTLYKNGSFLGGLSYDEAYFAHAEARVFAFLFNIHSDTTGDILPLHCLEGKSLQACNSSISSSQIFTDAVMYFDFGTGGAPEELGSAWRQHERIFISRSDGNIYRQYEKPEITMDSSVRSWEWNYPEWSNHPYFAIASVLVQRGYTENGSTDRRYRNEYLYAINLKDSTYIELAKSQDTLSDGNTSMRWPALWVENTGLSEDPTWLATPYYENTTTCELDTPTVVIPKPDSQSDKKDKSGCGSGAGLALLPPLWFKVRKRVMRG